MFPTLRAAFLAATFVLSLLSPAAANAAASPDGLVPVRLRGFDEAYLLPHADFRPYTRVLLEGARVSYRKGWLRDANDRGTTLIGRVTDDDARAFLESARRGFDGEWAEAFRDAGFEVVAASGEGVLRIAPRVVDLSVSAPAATTTGISRSFTTQAGEATLELEVRDSVTGALLGRIRDRRGTMKSPTLQRVFPGDGERDFRQLFGQWAVIAARELGTIRTHSPLPGTLSPGRSLGPR